MRACETRKKRHDVIHHRVSGPGPADAPTRGVDLVSKYCVYVWAARAFVWIAGGAADFVRTDSGGRYSLSAPLGADLWINAAAPGYIVEMVRSDSSEGPTLRLHRAVRARGIVVDQRGGPIVGVVITAEIDPSQRIPRSAYGALRRSESAPLSILRRCPVLPHLDT